MKLVKKVESTLSRKFILQHISDYDIYRYEIPELSIGRAMHSPMRKDMSPSFSVFMGQDGKLHHMDMADNRYKGDAFDLVCQKYGIALHQAIEKIAKDFGLQEGLNLYKAITSQYVKPIMDPRRHSVIQVSTKKFTKSDIQYWNQYLLDIEDLKKEDIYSVKELYLNRKRVQIAKDERVYAYYYSDGFKIYMPDKERSERWLSNITTAKVENIQALDTNQRVIITKAKKCRMCLSKLIPGVINVQNETRSCFTESFVEQLKGKDVYVQYDSDAAGKKNSKILTGELGYRHLNVPDTMLEYGVKDFSDWIKHDGNTKRVEEFMKIKGII